MTDNLTTASFDTLAALLKAKSGLIIGKDKIYLLETRLAGILKREKIADLNGLADRIRGPGNETLARDVVEAMTTNESFFFRDDKPFVHFRTQALPRLIAARPPGNTISHLVRGLVIRPGGLFAGDDHRRSPPQLGDHRIEIIGTDIARDQLARARQGLYTQFEVQRGLPVQMLMRYFKKEEANWRISEALRGMVQFREFNLLSDLAAARTFRRRILSQRAHLLRPGDQVACDGCRGHVVFAGRRALSRRRRDGDGDHARNSRRCQPNEGSMASSVQQWPDQLAPSGVPRRPLPTHRLLGRRLSQPQGHWAPPARPVAKSARGGALFPA